MKKIIASATIISALSGCTSFDNDQFSCAGSYEKGLCVPAQTSYELAEKGKDINDFHLPHSNETAHSPHGRQTSNHPNTNTENIANQASQSLSDVAPVAGTMRTPIMQPKPILKPAEVLLAWVNAYEDGRGYLHLPSTVFVEVTPRRWSLDATNIERYNPAGPFKVVKTTKNVANPPQNTNAQ